MVERLINDVLVDIAPKAILSEANLRGADLYGANLRGAEIPGEDAYVPPYTVTSVNEDHRGWSKRQVTVMRESAVIGKYEYDYYIEPPFFPFELDGQWYALYSRDYNASRIMKLPSMEDVWVEDKSVLLGFCPVEFFVPAVQNTNFGGDRTGKLAGLFSERYGKFKKPGDYANPDRTVMPPRYVPFGFVSGFVCGDDSSWNVQFFDLRKIRDGVVEYGPKFGYVKLPAGMGLRDAVNICDEFAKIVTEVKFYVETGKSADYLEREPPAENRD